jgi:hypothetical protein
MAWNYTEGFKKAILDSASYKSLFANGFIEIYSGGRPSNVEDSPAGTLLCIITNKGLPVVPGDPANGLNLELSGSSLGIAAGEEWYGTAVASGTAGYARYIENAANPSVWKDGVVTTTTGGDIVMTGGRSVVTGQPVTINEVNITAAGS